MCLDFLLQFADGVLRCKKLIRDKIETLSMGSARESQAKPIPMENTNKKSLKTLVVSFFRKKKEKPKRKSKNEITEVKTETKEPEQVQKPNIVATILENFDKLNLDDKKPAKDDKEDKTTEEEDELENFTFKVIEETRNERIHSHSSEDSGFSDTKDQESVEKEKEVKTETNDTDDLAEDLEKLGIDDSKKKKEKRLQTVHLSRTPIRHIKGGYAPAVVPYPQQDESYSKISSINKRALSGGQVLVNQCQAPDNFSEVKQALETVQKSSQYLQNDRETYLQDVMDFIKEDTNVKTIPQVVVTPEFQYQQHSSLEYIKKPPITNYSEQYAEKTMQHNELMQLLEQNCDMSPQSMSNSIDQFGQEEITEIFNYVQKEYNQTSNDGYFNTEFTYPTPPRSETVPSPMSASPGSFYPTNSEYTLSPERSPTYNSDYEKYQEIPNFDEEKEALEKRARERTASISSMTMKQFKDMQKEIVHNFSKKNCCEVTRKPCKELFKEHLQRISPAVRKNLCMNFAKLDLTEAYNVLEPILKNLSRSSEKEDVEYCLFTMVCERMLAQDPALFVGDAGLSILKSAALRCPSRPLLTRYLVECIRKAIKANPSLVANREYIFHEVDALGDNLVIACARAGDGCADVLSELVRPCDGQPPLFRLRHTNADGYTALHVACSQHSAASPRLHTVHVLLVHADFDITEGDLKGGDTALHLAVNSVHCDLQLILMIFKNIDRKEWKNLAHHRNLSGKTPLDLTRTAAKNKSRVEYPQEVLDFLKKCR